MTATDIGAFEEDGFTVARGLFRYDEIDRLCAEFTALHAAGPVPGHFAPSVSDDPLRTHPRVMHPHEISELALRFLLDQRLRTVLERLFDEEVLAAQSMFYFKPPGARGQALHQDNFYLRAEPGTCVAAWIACDEIDRENGGLEVVPGTHRMDLFCPEEADAGVSFAREYVPPPPGLTPVPVDMSPGTSCSSTAAWCTARSPITARTASAVRSSGTTWAARPTASGASTARSRWAGSGCRSRRASARGRAARSSHRTARTDGPSEFRSAH